MVPMTRTPYACAIVAADASSTPSRPLTRITATGQLALADAADELHAVHFGHLQIGDDDVDRLADAIQDGERLVSRRRLDDAGRAHAGQRPGEQIALVMVVVDDQEAQAAEIDRRRVGNKFDHAAVSRHRRSRRPVATQSTACRRDAAGAGRRSEARSGPIGHCTLRRTVNCIVHASRPAAPNVAPASASAGREIPANSSRFASSPDGAIRHKLPLSVVSRSELRRRLQRDCRPWQADASRVLRLPRRCPPSLC